MGRLKSLRVTERGATQWGGTGRVALHNNGTRIGCFRPGHPRRPSGITLGPRLGTLTVPPRSFFPPLLHGPAHNWVTGSELLYFFASLVSIMQCLLHVLKRYTRLVLQDLLSSAHFNFFFLLLNSFFLKTTSSKTQLIHIHLVPEHVVLL